MRYAPSGASRHLRGNRFEGKLTRLTTLAFALLLVGLSAASAGTAGLSAALALAAVVATYSPLLSSGEKKAVAAFFAGNAGFPYKKKISVTADSIVCRINVDITARSCELTFKKAIRGREASELYATEVFAGVPSDGAAGSIFESLSKPNCTLDPAGIKDKGGAGADCSYEQAN
jgi:hypothetical protein